MSKQTFIDETAKMSPSSIAAKAKYAQVLEDAKGNMHAGRKPSRTGLRVYALQNSSVLIKWAYRQVEPRSDDPSPIYWNLRGIELDDPTNKHE